jgi:type VI secretion system secreted protein VgrG
MRTHVPAVSSHAGTDELNLGHLRHQSDNRRLQTAGFGAELKTEHSVALRAGQGLLLSADARAGGSGAQLDSREAQAQIAQSHALQLSLAEAAQQHNAKLKDEAEPAKLAALAQMEHSGQVVQATAADAGGDVTAYSEPHLQLSSPAGIAAVTPAGAVLAAGNTASLSAGQDINVASQGGAYSLVRAGISLFTYGKAGSADKPNQETGIKLHAASGKVSVQSQSDAANVTADKQITVASVGKGVTASAKTYVMLTAQGASMKFEGGNIMLHGPGAIMFKASLKELAGPASSSARQELPKGDLKGCEQASKDASATQAGAQVL